MLMCYVSCFCDSIKNNFIVTKVQAGSKCNKTRYVIISPLTCASLCPTSLHNICVGSRGHKYIQVTYTVMEPHVITCVCTCRLDCSAKDNLNTNFT